MASLVSRSVGSTTSSPPPVPTDLVQLAKEFSSLLYPVSVMVESSVREAPRPENTSEMELQIRGTLGTIEMVTVLAPHG